MPVMDWCPSTGRNRAPTAQTALENVLPRKGSQTESTWCLSPWTGRSVDEVVAQGVGLGREVRRVGGS